MLIQFLRTAIILSLALLLVGCANLANSISSNQKFDNKSARNFAGKYFSHMNNMEYGKAYDLLDPETKKLLTKRTFVETEEEFADDKYKIGTVYLDKDNTAKVQLLIDTPEGRETFTDTIVFKKGQWYQSIEKSHLVDYGINPNKIPGIKKVSKQAIDIKDYALVIKKVSKRKNYTSSGKEKFDSDGVFLMIDMEVTNKDKFASDFFAGELICLFDSKGRQFIHADIEENAFITINPGIKKKLTAIFDVPESATGFSIFGGEHDEAFLIDLKI